MRFRTASARKKTAALALAASVALALGACGSNLDPADEAAARGVSQGPVGVDNVPVANATDGTVPSGGDVPTGSDSGPGNIPPAGSGTEGNSNSDNPGSAPTDQPSDAAPTNAGPKVSKGNCDGFKNGTGVTNDKIVLANASDVSGPVPGLFKAAQQGLQAYSAYFNATAPEGICGRKLETLGLDTKTDAGADQQAYAQACDKAFAAVGSLSVFDAGGVGTAEDCGIPDLRAVNTSAQRRNCSTCFSVKTINPRYFSSALPDFWTKKNKAATQSTAILYPTVGAAVENAKSLKNAVTKAGWDVKVFTGIEASEFNYVPYAQSLKTKGVKILVFIGAYQNTVKMQQALASIGYKLDAFMQDATVYDPGYISQAGDLAKGTIAFLSTEPFENARSPETKLYLQWLQQVAPGANPSWFGLYAWSAARLFTNQALELGGKLTRPSLIASLKGVKAWDDQGAHSPEEVGSKSVGKCIKLIQYDGSTWKPLSGSGFTCGSLIDTGVG